MKTKQYKIKYIDILGDAKEIALTDSFAMELVKNEKIEVSDIIKIMLPEDEGQAMELLKGEYEFQDNKYVAFSTTTGMMKQEETSKGEKLGRCEYLFIKKQHKDFIDTFEDTISLGKIKEKHNEKLYINKDIISRFSLAWSTAKIIEFNWKGKIVILPEQTYNYAREYIELDLDKIKSGEIELRSPVERIGEHTPFDGFGIATPELCDMLSEKYGYKIDYFGLRMYPLAVKGCVARFDFKKYMKDHYKEDIKDVFEKRVDGFYCRDMWGNMVNISKAELILSETQAKWGSWWNSIEEVEEAIEKSKHKDLYNNLYVGRVNKKELEEHTRLCYQLLNVINITPTELAELTKYDEEMFSSMIDKVNRNLDRIKIFMGDIAREDEEEISASTKIHYLMQRDEKFYKTKFVKEVICNMINKKVEELCGGKPFVKGNYKTLACCPVTLMESVMIGKKTTEIKEGLKEHEFYVTGDTGKRVLMRNPLASSHEVQKIELVQNSELSKYLGENYTKELIFFNMKDDTAKMISGADMDLDEGFVIDNYTIYNSIIDTIPFYNVADGAKADPLEFTRENMYKSILETRGDIIGSIAMQQAKINSFIQDIGFLTTKTGKVKTRRELKERFKFVNKEKFAKDYENEYKALAIHKSNKDELFKELETLEDKKEKNKCWDKINNEKDLIYLARKNINGGIEESFIESLCKKIEDGKIKDLLEEFSEDQIKQYINNRFEEYKKFVYFGLYLNQKAIDSVKTGKTVTEDEMQMFKKCLETISKIEVKGEEKEFKFNYAKWYPFFLKFTKDYAKTGKTDSYNRCALNKNSKRINGEILDKIKDIKKGLDDNPEIVLSVLKAEGKANITLVSKISGYYSDYKRIARRTGKMTNEEKINELWDELDEHIKTDIENNIKGEYCTKDIALALKNKKPSSRFILRYFFFVIKHYMDLEDYKINAYTKVEDGDIELFYKKYKRLNVKSASNVELVVDDPNEIRIGGYLGGYNGLTVDDVEVIVKDKHLFRVADNLDLGYIFDYDDKDIIEGQVIKVKETKPTGKSITLYY
jgi:hypothetical protein